MWSVDWIDPQNKIKGKIYLDFCKPMNKNMDVTTAASKTNITFLYF